jgi:hypothetical protein
VTALLLTALAVAPGLIILLMFCMANREPAKQATCGDPSCEACALLLGKWPKYNPGPREREAMGARRATREEILAAKDKTRAMALIRDAGGC